MFFRAITDDHSLEHPPLKQWKYVRRLQRVFQIVVSQQPFGDAENPPIVAFVPQEWTKHSEAASMKLTLLPACGFPTGDDHLLDDTIPGGGCIAVPVSPADEPPVCSDGTPFWRRI